MKTIGVIGCGNMGGAVLRGFAKTLDKSTWTLLGCNRSPQKLAPLAEMGIGTSQNVEEAAGKADILIFAVKPAQMPEVMRQASPCLKSGALLVSLAAAFSLANMRAAIGGANALLCRCMPTTTARAGKGIFAFCFEQAVKQEVCAQIMELFSHIGYCLRIPENKFTEFSGLIGAGPAYVFNIMRGLFQAALTLGFSHAQSRAMIIELFAGCALLAQKSDKHFIELSDEVCSPGGLTIAGINKLDEAGLTGILVQAVQAAVARGREMEK